MSPVADTALLEIRNLTVEAVGSPREPSRVLVAGVSISVPRAQIVGLVGESGSGKSVTSLSILGLLPRRQVEVKTGSISFNGSELLSLPIEEMRRIRGKRIAYVPQEPMTSLNPTVRVGDQLIRVLRTHERVDVAEARQRAATTLEQMHVRDPERVMRAYPFELSGGLRQRVLLANAFLCTPQLLIADEPTTALDVTVQAQVLQTLSERAERVGASVLLVTHNMGVVWNYCSHTYVMRHGQVVEHGETKQLFAAPTQTYTRELLDALPERATARHPISVAP